MDPNSWLPGEPHKEKFEEVCEQYRERIYLFCYRMLKDKQDAEDATAETFAAFWKRMSDIEGEAHIEPFLRIVARNNCINLWRRRGKWKMNELMEEDHRSAAVTPADIMEEREEYRMKRQQLETALAQLPERSREVFQLRYFEKKRFKDIAAILDIKDKTVYVHWRNAKAQLKKILNNGKK